MDTKQNTRCHRAGFTILELEVALVVFGIALMGIGPLVVMHCAHQTTLKERFDPATTHYLVPTADLWLRKLGASASVTTQNSAASPAPQPPPVNDVQIQSVDKALGSEVVTAHVTVQQI